MFTSPGAVAFTIGNMEIRWYGILIAAAFLIGGIMAYVRAPKFGINQDHFIDALIWSIPMAIIGARAYYVIFNFDMYRGDFLSMINIREGGLVIHGGLILGIATAAIVCKYHKMKFWRLADLIAPEIALGQAIGRWGNFFNSEAYGTVTDLPWALYINGVGYHPIFLYESIWCFLLFIFLMILGRRRKFDGQLLCLYVILYCAERFFVEILRVDPIMIGPFRQAQVISLCGIVVFICIYIFLKRRQVKR